MPRNVSTRKAKTVPEIEPEEQGTGYEVEVHTQQPADEIGARMAAEELAASEADARPWNKRKHHMTDGEQAIAYMVWRANGRNVSATHRELRDRFSIRVGIDQVKRVVTAYEEGTAGVTAERARVATNARVESALESFVVDKILPSLAAKLEDTSEVHIRHLATLLGITVDKIAVLREASAPPAQAQTNILIAAGRGGSTL